MKKLILILTVILYGCNYHDNRRIEATKESKYFKVLELNESIPDMYLVTLDDSTQYYLIKVDYGYGSHLIKKEKP